ncbi:MAG: hypothetical protein ABFD14_06670, partial [Anaerolineaceae bacterium]
GHFVNLDGHVQEAVASLKMPEQVKHSSEAVKAIADKLGIKVNGDGWKKELTAHPTITEIVTA